MKDEYSFAGVNASAVGAAASDSEGNWSVRWWWRK